MIQNLRQRMSQSFTALQIHLTTRSRIEAAAYLNPGHTEPWKQCKHIMSSAESWEWWVYDEQGIRNLIMLPQDKKLRHRAWALPERLNFREGALLLPSSEQRSERRPLGKGAYAVHRCLVDKAHTQRLHSFDTPKSDGA